MQTHIPFSPPPRFPRKRRSLSPSPLLVFSFSPLLQYNNRVPRTSFAHVFCSRPARFLLCLGVCFLLFRTVAAIGFGPAREPPPKKKTIKDFRSCEGARDCRWRSRAPLENLGNAAARAASPARRIVIRPTSARRRKPSSYCYISAPKITRPPPNERRKSAYDRRSRTGVLPKTTVKRQNNGSQ